MTETDEKKRVEELAKAMFAEVYAPGSMTWECCIEQAGEDEVREHEVDVIRRFARAALSHLKYDEVLARADLCGEMEQALRDLFVAVRAFHAEENYDFPELGGKVNTGNRYPAMQDCATDAASVLRKYGALGTTKAEEQADGDCGGTGLAVIGYRGDQDIEGACPGCAHPECPNKPEKGGS